MREQVSFFYVFIPNQPRFALAEAKNDPALGKRVRDGGWIAEWEPPSFELEDGIVVDYLPNSFAFRLCSQRLRDVLESNRGDSDTVQWLPAPVRDRQGAQLSYWVLHFPDVPDVIHRTKSVFSGSVMVKPCIDASLVQGHRLLSWPHNSVTLVIANEVKNAIASGGCTGMTFSKIPIG